MRGLIAREECKLDKTATKEHLRGCVANISKKIMSTLAQVRIILSHQPVELRWLDWIFLGGYLPSLSLNYVGMSKDMEKRLPQLYYIKMKISYDLGFIAIGVSMAT